MSTGLIVSRKVCNLRSADWRQVDQRQLKEAIEEDRATGYAQWTVTPWQRHSGRGDNFRSYLLHSTDGAVYGVFLSRTRSYPE